MSVTERQARAHVYIWSEEKQRADAAEARAEKAEAANRLLREALEKIADDNWSDYVTETARAALTETKE